MSMFIIFLGERKLDNIHRQEINTCTIMCDLNVAIHLPEVSKASAGKSSTVHSQYTSEFFVTQTIFIYSTISNSLQCYNL